MAASRDVHPLVEGIHEIAEGYRRQHHRDRIFEDIYNRIQANWLRHRQPDRWPSVKNWVLRVSPEFTSHPTQYLEKQLQKQIAISLEHEGWGNDMPTASGLVDSRGRQMNIDIARECPDGFELFEIKVASDTPYDAAVQVLRYGAVHMLYRREVELARRFSWSRVIRAQRIALKVMAPHAYYSESDVDLPLLERQLDSAVEKFASRHVAGLALSFQFLAFPRDFIYRPGIDRELICDAVRRRASPFG